MTAILILHYMICAFLILFILLQAGKGADIGAVFGAGSSQTVFGSKGPATFLSKATAVIAIMFIVTSIALAHMSKQEMPKSVFEKAPATEQAVPQTNK